MTNQSLFHNALEQLEHAYKHVTVSDDAKAVLAQPKESLSFSIPVRMDDGSLNVFPAFRVHYNDYVESPERLKPLFDWLGAPWDEQAVRDTMAVKHSY